MQVRNYILRIYFGPTLFNGFHYPPRLSGVLTTRFSGGFFVARRDHEIATRGLNGDLNEFLLISWKGKSSINH